MCKCVKEDRATLGGQEIALRPLCLDDLPVVCKWVESISGKVDWAFDEKTLDKTLVFRVVIDSLSCKGS